MGKNGLCDKKESKVNNAYPQGQSQNTVRTCGAPVTDGFVTRCGCVPVFKRLVLLSNGGRVKPVVLLLVRE
jgi:hypothetical protein